MAKREFLLEIGLEEMPARVIPDAIRVAAPAEPSPRG